MQYHRVLAAVAYYLYIPLGGSWKGQGRRFINILVTMFLGGLWHGAGWTFIVWGSFHGLLLVLNHMWLFLRKQGVVPRLPTAVAWGLTFLSVVIGWVFFRSDNLPTAISMLMSMAGIHAPSGYQAWEFHQADVDIGSLLRLGGFILITVFAPNVYQFLRAAPAPDGLPDKPSRIYIPQTWLQTRTAALLLGFLFLYILWTAPEIHEFLYFQF